MSMTQVAFLRKAELPTRKKIEDSIRGLGYDFEILDDFESFYGQDGLSCKINGHETFLETSFDDTSEITDEFDWIKPNLTDQDTAVSFRWGADFAAGASIGLISIALIDNSDALIYYLDDEVKYSRQMLLTDTPEFLKELEKQGKIDNQNIITPTKAIQPKKNFWDRIKDMLK